MAGLTWHCDPLTALSAAQLYQILALRARVFVLEQQCVYLDPDGLDLEALHLRGLNEAGELQAYARLLPPGLKGPEQTEPAIGRVLTAPEARGQGQGQQLMSQAVAEGRRLWPGLAQVLSAQAHLQRFYAGFGFVPISEVYDDDGIPHIDMRLP
nr:GNAT family N-acetyltransferase [uncultured Roseateles sp.]